MITMTPQQLDRLEALEKILGSPIEGEAHVMLWPLPMIEALTAKLVALTARVVELEGRMGE